MDADLGQLDKLAAELEAVDKVGVAIATGAQSGVQRIVRATASAGTTPDGEAWPPKKDGGKALAGAAEAISVAVSGTTKAVLTLILRGVFVYHQRSKNKSTTKGLPRREILPNPKNGIPAAIVEEIAKSAKRELARLFGGRS